EADRLAPDRRQTAGSFRVHLLAVHHDAPRRRRQDASGDRKERGFARTGRPFEGYDFAARERERDSVQDRNHLTPLPELFGDIERLQNIHRPRLSLPDPEPRTRIPESFCYVRNTSAGSMVATLRNEITAAARHIKSAPAKTTAPS